MKNCAGPLSLHLFSILFCSGFKMLFNVVCCAANCCYYCLCFLLFYRLIYLYHNELLSERKGYGILILYFIIWAEDSYFIIIISWESVGNGELDVRKYDFWILNYSKYQIAVLIRRVSRWPYQNVEIAMQSRSWSLPGDSSWLIMVTYGRQFTSVLSKEKNKN